MPPRPHNTDSTEKILKPFQLDPLSQATFAELTARSTRARRKLSNAVASERLMEIMYQNMVHEIVRQHEFNYVPFPVQGAANYGLLYVIYRVISETDVRSLCELGAGQSTLFVDQLSRTRELRIRTYEQDVGWAELLSPRVRHPVLHQPLVERSVRGHVTATYTQADDDEHYDMLVIDGPEGNESRSRWGALEFIEHRLADDFVIVFDDAERKGEQDTIRETLDLFRERGTPVYLRSVQAMKTQLVIVTEKYRHLQVL